MIEQRASDSWGARAQVLLSILVVLAVLYIEGSMVLYGTPQTIEPVLLGRIIGTLETALLMILGYWFTASASERGKDAALQSIARKDEEKKP